MRLQYAIHEAGAAHVVEPSEAMLREAIVRALVSLCSTMDDGRRAIRREIGGLLNAPVRAKWLSLIHI